MARITRRGFLKKTSTGAVAIGALGALPGVALGSGLVQAPAAHAAETTETAADAPFVVYVRNPAAGEIAMLVGKEEIRYTDHDLVARLWRARREQHAVKPVVR